ncbi:hypothetical protein CB1_000786001, partial [Camelus ferus]
MHLLGASQVNCLDQHVWKSPESVALIWERDEPGTEVRITYSPSQPFLLVTSLTWVPGQTASWLCVAHKAIVAGASGLRTGVGGRAPKTQLLPLVEDHGSLRGSGVWRGELLETTCRLANTLKRHGVCRGDRVAIYMPASPLSVAAMLACARIGAVHSVVFAGFSAVSLTGRINDAKCKVVITVNQALRGGRVLELKRIVDEAVKHCPSVQHVMVAHRTDRKVYMGDLDIPLEQ